MNIMQSLKESVLTVVEGEDGDNPENESQYTSLVNNIRDSFYSNFPNGFFNATESKRFSHSIAISFGMIKNLDDVAFKIRENDPMLGRIFIWLSTAPEYKVELSVGGLSLNPDPGSYHAMKHLKFPWRNFKTTDLAKIENQFKVFFGKLKDTVKANQDNIYKADSIPKQYFVESNVSEGFDDPENLPKGVRVSDNMYRGNFGKEVIAVLLQRDAAPTHDQFVFKASDYDRKEFGNEMKPGDVLVRVSTPLSEPGNQENRSIARINFNKVTISFPNNEAYENDDKIIWERPTRLKFLLIDPEELNYFKGSNSSVTEDSHEELYSSGFKFQLSSGDSGNDIYFKSSEDRDKAKLITNKINPGEDRENFLKSLKRKGIEYKLADNPNSQKESLTGNSIPTVNIKLTELLQASTLVSKYPGAITVTPISRNNFSLTLNDQSLMHKDPLIAKLFSKGASQEVSESGSNFNPGRIIPPGYEDPKEVFSSEFGKVFETKKHGRSYFFGILSDGELAGGGKPLMSKSVAVAMLKTANARVQSQKDLAAARLNKQ